jgi:ABC-type phosphate transport system substrate-binding protein
MRTFTKTLFAVALLSGVALSATAGEVAVIVSPENPATKMFPEQAAQFFLGKSSMFTPVDLPESSGVRNDFYKKLADKDPEQVKALWSKLAFTGKATPPKEYSSAAELKKAVAANPKAIGYIDKSAVDGTVKVILTLP